MMESKLCRWHDGEVLLFGDGEQLPSSMVSRPAVHDGMDNSAAVYDLERADLRQYQFLVA